MVADDLDGVLVGANGTVAAETPELALDGARGSSVGGVGIHGQRQVGDVVHDADGELLLGSILLELVVHGEGCRGRLVLGAEAVAAADDGDVGEAGLVESGDDVLVERLAHGAGLLGAVEDGDLLGGLGQDRYEVLDGERTIEVNLDQADLLALGNQVVDDLLERVAEGAHADHNAVGVGSAVVVERLVVRADALVDLVHVRLDDVRKLVVEGVAGLAVLEERVSVLVGATGVRVIRVECVVAEGLHGAHVEHLAQLVEVPGSDLLDLVGGAEAVEEVEERGLALDGSEVRDRGKVHDLLDVALAEHGKAGLAAGHDVGVVAKDVQRLRGDGTGAHVEDRGELLGSDLVHVGDHEEQALGCGIGAREGTCAKRAVNGACGAGLRLHLNNLDRSTKDILHALSGPLVDVVGHRARRRDRVDARHLRVGIRHPSRSLVAVHRLEFSRHILSFSAMPPP